MTTNGATSAPPRADRSLGELLKDLSHQTVTLARQEVGLAKAEMRAKARAGAAGAAMLTVGAVLGLAALGALVACAIAAIALELPTWAAALVVGGALLLVAAIIALAGVSALRRATPPAPEETVESVKEDVRWITTQS